MRLRFGANEIDVARHELRVAGEVRPVQPQVFALLAYLVRHRDRVIAKDELLRQLWPDAVVTDASLQRAVSLARRALRPDNGLLRPHARVGPTDLLEMNLDIDVRPLLPRVRAPAVVLHAAGDRVVRVGNGRALAAAVPGARLVEVPGDDHAFLFGGRPRLERELTALVEQTVAGRGVALT